jgi:hypothetical protein
MNIDFLAQHLKWQIKSSKLIAKITDDFINFARSNKKRVSV